MFKGMMLGFAVAFLAGCNADMMLSVNVSDLQNPASNDKIIQGALNVEIVGDCIDKKTGVESDTLSKVDGIAFNLFGRRHERVSCIPQDDYGFRSVVKYQYDVALDTIKDGKSPVDDGQNLAIEATTDIIKIRVSEKLKNRLNARLSSADNVDFYLYLNINNDTGKAADFTAFGVYYWDEKLGSYIPAQKMQTTVGRSNVLSLKAGSVAVDNLLATGSSWMAISESQ